MEVLDSDDEKQISELKGVNSGIAAAIFIMIGCVFALVSILGFVLMLTADPSSLGIDGMTAGTRIAMYKGGGRFVFWAFLIGTFLHYRAFYKFEYRKPWLWWVVLIGSCLNLMCSALLFSGLTGCLGVQMLIHALSAKEQYFEQQE